MPIPDEYWTLGASIFAYGYLGALREGVDMLAASELVDYPTQLAGTNLINWTTGKPDAGYRVVKMLHDDLPPGSTLLKTSSSASDLEAQGFDTPEGRKLLLINKTMELIRVCIQLAPTARDGAPSIEPNCEALLGRKFGPAAIGDRRPRACNGAVDVFKCAINDFRNNGSVAGAMFSQDGTSRRDKSPIDEVPNYPGICLRRQSFMSNVGNQVCPLVATISSGDSANCLHQNEFHCAEGL